MNELIEMKFQIENLTEEVSILKNQVNFLLKERQDNYMTLATRQLCSSLTFVLSEQINSEKITFNDIINNEFKREQIKEILQNKCGELLTLLRISPEELLVNIIENCELFKEQGNVIAHHNCFDLTFIDLKHYYQTNNKTNELELLYVFNQIRDIHNEFRFLETSKDIEIQRKKMLKSILLKN